MRKLRRLAVDADDAVAGPQAHETFHQLRPPGADKAGKAEYLALSQPERRLLREPGGRKIFDLQDCFSGSPCVAVGIKLGHVATNHQTRHIDRLQFVGRMAGDNAAVAQHGHLVGDLLNLWQPVRNIEDANALGTDIGDDLEQSPSFN